jgi:hypothetical protein
MYTRGDVVAVRDGGRWNVAVELAEEMSKARSHVHSATALATARYSASALERETVGCRFDDHDTSESPTNTQKADVERRVSGHPAQSASEYAVMDGVDEA